MHSRCDAYNLHPHYAVTCRVRARVVCNSQPAGRHVARAIEGGRDACGADGNYALDEYGNAMLEDADGVLITAGYGNDGYGGYTAGPSPPDDQQTNVSSSTNTFNAAGRPCSRRSRRCRSRR